MNKLITRFFLVLLMALPIALVSCDDDDDYYPQHPGWVDDGGNGGGDKPQTPLIGMWQGTINGYYSEVWGLEGDNYVTVCEFMDDGNGRQLDYDRFSPRTDFAYTPFTWMQTQDAVTIAYAPDSHLSAVRISDFALTDVEFSGRMAYGDKTFTFAMGRITSFDWSPYTGPHNVSPAGRGLAAKRKTASLIVRQGAFAGR